MDEIVRVSDQWGREIVLTRSQWRTHVLVRYADIQGTESMIADTLTSPSFVNHDRVYADREIFYRPSPRARPVGSLLVRVIVRFGVVGQVVTAHLIESAPRKEIRKWP
jgi:hypothetical protein